MLSKEEIEKVMKEIEFTPEHYPCQPKGGQHVAMSPRGVRITHIEMGLSIHVGFLRTQMENRAAALLLFEQALTLLP